MAITKNRAHTSRSEQVVLNKSMDDKFDVLAVESVEFSPAPAGGQPSLKRKVTDNLAIRVATDSGDSNITYIGRATIGSATSSAAWQIQKIDGTSGTVITWADGNDKYDNVWDNRESLSYS